MFEYTGYITHLFSDKLTCLLNIKQVRCFFHIYIVLLSMQVSFIDMISLKLIYEYVF